MDYAKLSLKMHEENQGKIEVVSKVKIDTRDDLSTAYTPGVAEPCNEISKDYNLMYQYTNKGNMVAVVTDGSSVLGLGNIGSKASMPVMEGKALLFKELANIDAFPICLASQDKEDIIFSVKQGIFKSSFIVSPSPSPLTIVGAGVGGADAFGD